MYALETLDPCHWLCVVKPQRPWAPQWYLSSKPTNAETLKCGSYTRWHNLRAISTAGSLPTGTTAPLGILAGKCSLSGSCFEPWAQAALALEAKQVSPFAQGRRAGCCVSGRALSRQEALEGPSTRVY